MAREARRAEEDPWTISETRPIISILFVNAEALALSSNITSFCLWVEGWFAR
jgi:hypothetical protein